MFYGGLKGTHQIAITFLFIALASFTVLIRSVVRLVILKTFGLDDVLICAALSFSIAFGAMIFEEVHHGQGLHDVDLPHGEYITLRYIIWKSIPIYITALLLVKLSILFLYLRFFQDKTIRCCTIALICFVVAFGITAVLTTVFACDPISYFWDSTQRGGHCINQLAVWFFNGSMTLVTDVATLVLPMPVLSQLRLPKRQRLELMSVFALGALAFLCSVVRLPALWFLLKSGDSAHYNGRAAILSSIEVNVGIICASLPALRSTLVNAFRHLFPPKPVLTASVSPNMPFTIPNPKDLELGAWDKRLDGGSTILSGTTLASNCLATNRTSSTAATGSGIVREVTITTKNERRPSRRMSVMTMPRIWDGGEGNAWVSVGEEQ